MPKVTVELDEESIAAAREAGIDLSELLLRALYRLLPNLHAAARREADLKWQEENREAIEAVNKMIEEHGLFYERHRDSDRPQK
jgi:antitoxin CcdA